VTGGSRGIGRAIARRLADDGALVAINFERNGAAADEAVAEIAAAGGEAFAIQADLGSLAGVRTLFAALERELDRRGRKGLDILVNNAGIAPDSGLADTDEATFDRLFAVNVKGPFFAIQEAARHLNDNGRVINLSTALTRLGSFPHKAVYAATKGAIDALTLNLANTLGPRGITINTVNPGAVDTDMNADWIGASEARAQLTSGSALRRVGTAHDIAGVAAFLASDDARWVTAQHIEASGGFQL
jgi:3-oxoacyl-[acyl-carrier protein] reductase